MPLRPTAPKPDHPPLAGVPLNATAVVAFGLRHLGRLGDHIPGCVRGTFGGFGPDEAMARFRLPSKPDHAEEGSWASYTITTPQGILAGQGTLISHPLPDTRGGFSVELRLERWRMIDERRVQRVTVPDLRAVCIMPGRMVECPVEDVSASGMLIRWGVDWPNREKVQVRFTPPMPPDIMVEGRPVRKSGDPPGPSFLAVEFLWKDEEARERMHALCALHGTSP